MHNVYPMYKYTRILIFKLFIYYSPKEKQLMFFKNLAAKSLTGNKLITHLTLYKT